MSATARRWTYTLYPQTPDDFRTEFSTFESKLRDLSHFRGLCHQLELCPSTERIHLQGYVEFDKPKRRAAIKSVSERVHLEPAKGSRKQCIDYCTKTESRFETGTCDPVLLEETTQGKRNDILDVTLQITRGQLTRDQVFSDRPDLICKYHRGINELFNWREKSERMADRELHVEVLWGDAGVGKTRFAYNSTEPEDVYILNKGNSNNLWWDNYDGQSVLVIDDFYGWIQHSILLRILDRYPYQMEIKGGYTWAAWTTVYITSNKHPSTWYPIAFPWTDDQALQRRLNNIYDCKATIFGSTWTCEKTKVIRTIDQDFNVTSSNH